MVEERMNTLVLLVEEEAKDDAQKGQDRQNLEIGRRGKE